MDEKTMVSDTLAGISGELVRYGEMIPQTENKELKQTLKQIRNQCEMSQGRRCASCWSTQAWRKRMFGFPACCRRASHW